MHVKNTSNIFHNLNNGTNSNKAKWKPGSTKAQLPLSHMQNLRIYKSEALTENYSALCCISRLLQWWTSAIPHQTQCLQGPKNYSRHTNTNIARFFYHFAKHSTFTTPKQYLPGHPVTVAVLMAAIKETLYINT